MSVMLPGSWSAAANEPIVIDDLPNYFLQGAKPRSEWRIGAEFEKFALDAETGRAITFDEPGGIRDILQSLVKQFGWVPHANDGVVTTLTRNGSTISLEPGNQVEFSSPPLESLRELQGELQQHREELHSVVDPKRICWVSAGVTPFAHVDSIPEPIRPRHRLMADVLPKTCTTAHEMMRATASTQAAYDYADEADAIRKWTVALKLGPIINSLWANSAYSQGRATGWVSERARIWLGMDQSRCGVLAHLLSRGISFQTWIDKLLDLPLLFTFDHGEYHRSTGQTFRQAVAHGLHGRAATHADWELHLTTVFPEVRLKTFLEVRGADATPMPLALSVPAFWKGILYCEPELTTACQLVEAITPKELQSLYRTTAEQGMKATLHGRSIADWVGELLELASTGLGDEAWALAPAYLRLDEFQRNPEPKPVPTLSDLEF